MQVDIYKMFRTARHDTNHEVYENHNHRVSCIYLCIYLIILFTLYSRDPILAKKKTETIILHPKFNLDRFPSFFKAKRLINLSKIKLILINYLVLA